METVRKQLVITFSYSPSYREQLRKYFSFQILESTYVKHMFITFTAKYHRFKRKLDISWNNINIHFKRFSYFLEKKQNTVVHHTSIIIIVALT